MQFKLKKVLFKVKCNVKQTLNIQLFSLKWWGQKYIEKALKGSYDVISSFAFSLGCDKLADCA